jgi:hypothetical protein
MRDHSFERAVEAPRQRVAAEHFHPPRVRHHIVGVGGRRERA